MDKTPMTVLFDTGASKSYMSKSFYMANTSLHTLPKFSTISKGIIVGNGKFVPVMFITSTKTGSFKFLNRSIPIYPKDNLEVPSMGKTYLKVICPFSEKLNGKDYH